METPRALMPSSFVIDTNILIAHLSGEEVVVQQLAEWKRQGCILFVSSIAECEVLSYQKLSTADEVLIENFLSDNFLPIPFDMLRARRAAALRRIVPSLHLPDAAIAALALETHSGLVTRNSKDFKKIPGIILTTL